MSKNRKHLDKSDKRIISEMYHNQQECINDLVETFNSNRRSIVRIINNEQYFPSNIDTSETEPKTVVKTIKEPADQEIVEHNVKIANQLQRNQDLNRVKNKAVRDHTRAVNAVNEYTGELIKVLESNNVSSLTVHHSEKGTGAVGIIQLSDLHLGEVIELETNQFNFDIASRRLRKLVNRAKTVFKSEGIEKVLIAFSADLQNSDRRLEELLTNATSRSSTTFIAVDILQQLILDLNKDFNVSVASVCGNESRVGEFISWVDQIASDNYDATIHNMLAKLFEGSKGVKFLPMLNPLEKVVNISTGNGNSKNILLIHGHNGIASNNSIEAGVNKLISRYAMGGVSLDYVLMGHIHSSCISDFYARSSGLPGGNAYSERGLNLISRAAQNIYIVRDDCIDGMKIDLQNVDDVQPYSYNMHLTEPTTTNTSGISICNV